MSANAKVVYLKLNDNWSASEARYYVHVWGGSSSNTSIEMQAVEGETNMYKIEVGTHNSIIFLRHKTTTTVTDGNKWNNLLNRLGNLSIPDDNNCCTIKNGVTTVENGNNNGAASSVTWSTYTPAEPEPEPEPVETHDITVKAKYPATWTAGKAAIHFWGTGVASPATPAAMTKDGDWWTYTVTGVPTTSELSVIFINGDNWKGDANQTVDITGITESTCYQVTAGSGKALAAKADCETGEAEVIETHDITVKAFYPASWNAGKAAVHFWGDGVASPGTPAAMTKDGDWWTYTVTGVPTTTELSVIFINGNTWNGDANQTVDITGIKESTCYQITSGSGKASAAVVDCASTPATPEPEPTELTYNVTVPAGTKACYICGNMTGWNFNEMTKVDDTHYTITIAGAKKSDGYKYASGGEWGYVEKDASGNEIGNRTYVDGNDVVASWASVYDPDAVEQELTYSVTVPEGTYACYIAMDTDPAQDGWEFNEMTKVDETHYTYVRTGLKNKTYKYTSGPSWEYVEKTAEDGEVADRQWAENDVVAKWTSVYNPTAPTYDYYLTGSLVGGWEPKQQGIEKDDELYKATFSELAAGTYEFKITAGDWEHQWNYNNLGAAYEEVSQGVDGEGNPNGNIKIVTKEAKNITVIFDATAGKITFEGLTLYVAPLTYTVTVPAGTEKCYIAGAFAQSNWNTFVEMTKVGDEDKFTIEIVGAKETDEYKYACQADWAYAEVIDGGGNRTTWTELDEVTAWGKPVVVTYQLKGVGGWDQPGIELVQNPGNDKEYMLTCQAISATDAIKVVRLEDGVIKDYYGKGTVKDAVEVTVNYDGDGNITLLEGKYNFYFDTNEPDKKLWIAAATDCGTEPTPDYTRAVTPGNLGTICLPSNVPAGKASGATFYTLAGMDANGRVAFDEVTGELAAGVSYLFQATATEIVCFYGTESVLTPDEDGAMKGTFVNMTLTELTDIYYFAKNALWSCVDLTELIVPANCAYVDMGKVEPITGAAPVGVRRITLGVNGAQVATGVDQVQGDEVPTKMIINGQLFILRGEKMYDAQGKLVK